MVAYLAAGGSNAVVVVDIAHSKQVQLPSSSAVDAEDVVVERQMVLRHRNDYLHSQK